MYLYLQLPMYLSYSVPVPTASCAPELQKELDCLINSECIESSDSPYSSGLKLIREDRGSLWVCKDYIGLTDILSPSDRLY